MDPMEQWWMSQSEQQAAALDVVQARLERYDRIWDFILDYDPELCHDDDWHRGYAEGAQVVIDQIREILSPNDL